MGTRMTLCCEFQQLCHQTTIQYSRSDNTIATTNQKTRQRQRYPKSKLQRNHQKDPSTIRPARETVSNATVNATQKQVHARRPRLARSSWDGRPQISFLMFHHCGRDGIVPPPPSCCWLVVRSLVVVPILVVVTPSVQFHRSLARCCLFRFGVCVWCVVGCATKIGPFDDHTSKQTIRIDPHSPISKNHDINNHTDIVGQCRVGGPSRGGTPPFLVVFAMGLVSIVAFGWVVRVVETTTTTTTSRT